MPSLNLIAGGLRHKSAAGQFAHGRRNVSLIPEPENEFDPRAIAVYSQPMVQIGFYAERASRIGSRLGCADVVAVFQRLSKFGAWVRVAVDGLAPILTDAMLDDVEDGAQA